MKRSSKWSSQGNVCCEVSHLTWPKKQIECLLRLGFLIGKWKVAIFLDNYKCPHTTSSHQRCYMKKGVLKNFPKFTGKHLCQSFFFNKVADLRSAPLFKKRLWHTCFLVNCVKFLRTPFLQNTSGRPHLSKAAQVLSMPDAKYGNNWSLIEVAYTHRYLFKMSHCLLVSVNSFHRSLTSFVDTIKK